MNGKRQFISKGFRRMKYMLHAQLSFCLCYSETITEIHLINCYEKITVMTTKKNDVQTQIFFKKYYGKLSNPQDYIQGIGILFSKTAKYNTFYVPAQVELNIF